MFFTSLCIAIHSGGGERNIMASRTTKGGFSWRLRCGQDTNFTGNSYPLLSSHINITLFNALINFQQFFKHDFSETHVRTAKPFRYRSCLVCDTMIRELIVLGRLSLYCSDERYSL